jgi:CubicO group peptidase (beta-lactamase class C family)
MAVSHPLLRSTPEDVGIPSSAVSDFVGALARSGQEVHSFMLLRHGAVAAEAWWKPYAPELRHMLFSLSKSFTSTAVGMAVSEGLLSVEDPVLRFFPEQAPRRPSRNLEALRLRHLLSMSTGHEKDCLDRMTRAKSRDWVRTILSFEVEKEPGSLFVYNSGATYLLSAVVQKVTGQRLVDYLAPRLFEPLGIQGATWETCPKGINTGGWGLSVTTEDIAKFGQLYLEKGQWGGRRLVPEAWIDEATRYQVSNAGGDKIDWTQGYGYQFWRCRHGAYRGDGAFGQFCVVMPEQDAVLAMTSGAGNMQAILDAFWETLPGVMSDQVKVVAKRQRELRRTLRSLKLEPPPVRDDAEAAADINGATYQLEANQAKLRSIAFSFARGMLVVKIRGRRTNTYRCGAGRWAAGRARRDDSPDRSSQPVRCAYRWIARGELEFTIRAITTPFRTTCTCRFAGDTVELSFAQNVSFGPTEPAPIAGRRAGSA